MPNTVDPNEQPNPPAEAAWDPNAMLQPPVAAAAAVAPTDNAAQVMMPPEQQGYGQALAAAATSVEVPELPAFVPTQWDKNFGELKAFKEQFGHTDVTTNDHKELADWVFFQKQEYRNMMNGQTTTLTPEQANQLLQVSCVGCTKRLLLLHCLRINPP